MPEAMLLFSISGDMPWPLIALVAIMSVLLPVSMILARRRLTLGWIMILILFVAFAVTEIRQDLDGGGHRRWLEAGCLLEMLAYFLAGYLSPDPSGQPRNLTSEQCEEVDAYILGGDPRAAVRLVREFTGQRTPEAEAIHLERYRKLRAEQPQRFLISEEQYWRCFYD